MVLIQINSSSETCRKTAPGSAKPLKSPLIVVSSTMVAVNTSVGSIVCTPVHLQNNDAVASKIAAIDGDVGGAGIEVQKGQLNRLK